MILPRAGSCCGTETLELTDGVHAIPAGDRIAGDFPAGLDRRAQQARGRLAEDDWVARSLHGASEHGVVHRHLVVPWTPETD